MKTSMFVVQASKVPKDVYVTNETTGLFRLRSLDVAKTLVVAEQQVFVLKVPSVPVRNRDNMLFGLPWHNF
jgi:hypothetical protein